MSKQVGLIGVGLLGTALAERLGRAGYQVIGFDVDSSRLDCLRQSGGRTASSAEQIASQSSRLVLSLPDSQVVREVIDRITGSLAADSIVLDTTTGAPDAAESLGTELAQRQIAYLDATVAGSSEQARAGEIVMMVGGEALPVERCQDLFSALARKTFHVGPAGSGARMKLVVNLVLGLNRAVLAEGLSLARACGMDPAMALEVLRSGAAYSAAMDSKGPKMVRGEFTPQARLAQHRKDVALISSLAETNKLALPLSRVHAELLDRAMELGFGELDNSAVIKAFG